MTIATMDIFNFFLMLIYIMLSLNLGQPDNIQAFGREFGFYLCPLHVTPPHVKDYLNALMEKQKLAHMNLEVSQPGFTCFRTGQKPAEIFHLSQRLLQSGKHSERLRSVCEKCQLKLTGTLTKCNCLNIECSTKSSDMLFAGFC